jgi:hypothetical protein
MNVTFVTSSTSLPTTPQQTIALAKTLIDDDDAKELDKLVEMLDAGTITSNTPSGENGETLLMYAVRQYALLAFLDMAEHASANHLDLNVTDWNGNSVWHAIALYLDDGEFSEAGGWPNRLDELLAEHPQLQIDWTLRNLHDETPLDAATNLGKAQVAAWITSQMEGPAAHPMDIDSD